MPRKFSHLPEPSTVLHDGPTARSMLINPLLVQKVLDLIRALQNRGDKSWEDSLAQWQSPRHKKLPLPTQLRQIGMEDLMNLKKCLERRLATGEQTRVRTKIRSVMIRPGKRVVIAGQSGKVLEVQTDRGNVVVVLDKHAKTKPLIKTVVRLEEFQRICEEQQTRRKKSPD